jgi:hypothetical protein
MAGFKVEFEIPEDNFSKTLSIYGTVDCTIYWGDGESSILTSYLDDGKTHEYALAGTYTIEIIGDCEIITFYDDLEIRRIVHWGDPADFLGFSSFPGFDSSELRRVEDGSVLERSPGIITTLQNRFKSSKIEYVGKGIFDNLTGATNFNDLFNACKKLVSIPDGLFDKNILADSFLRTFSMCYRLPLSPYIFYGEEAGDDFIHTKETRFIDRNVLFRNTFGIGWSSANNIGGKGFDASDYFPTYGHNGYFGGGGNGYNSSTRRDGGGGIYGEDGLINSGGGGGGNGNGGSGIVLIRYEDNGNKVIVPFITVGNNNWTVPSAVTIIDLLIVAGGGGGGSYYSGGGGGGGVIFKPYFDISDLGSEIAITVGNGGAKAVNSTVPGSNGENSSFDELVAIGGGGGGSGNSPNGLNGGNGGGGSNSNDHNDSQGGMNIPNQGSPGASPTNYRFGGGGGGAFAAAIPMGTAPDLWNCDFGTVEPDLYDGNVFGWYYNNENLSNYFIIPAEWGGNPVNSTFSVTRISSTRFNVDVDPGNFTGNYYLRIVDLSNDSIIYEQTTLLAEITLPNDSADNHFSIQLHIEYQTGQYTIIKQETYTHYYYDQVQIDTIDIPSSDYISELSKDGKSSKLIHGCTFYNGYIYGSPRHYISHTVWVNACFAKIPVNDYSTFELLEITPAPGYDTTSLTDFEQIVRIGNYLFSVGRRQQLSIPDGITPMPDGFYLVCIDTSDFSYKLFKISIASFSSEPIATDGSYLFISGILNTKKIDPQIFINAPDQFYIDNYFDYSSHLLGTYNHNSQGGYLDFPQQNYGEYDKGRIHASVADSEYLYLAFVTGDNSGYESDLGIDGVHELHVIRKSDMTPAGWSYIPKCTDDMTQTTTHLFFGIEVQADADPNTYGYGWGAYTIKKSDIINIDHSLGYTDVIKALPPLHETDDPPSIQSYASIIFGNYLLDYHTNKKVYILDITDADNWSINEGVGKRTIKVVNFTVDGSSYDGIINEAALDETETFHSFLWKTVSGAIKYQISGLTFFESPTVNTLSVEIVNSDVTLNGFILDENGKPVTEKGFEYGTNDDPDTWTNSIPGEGNFSFTALLSDFEDGTYYYRAYAVNEIGTGYGEVISFSVESSIIGYIGTTPLVKIYIGNTEITSLQL